MTRRVAYVLIGPQEHGALEFGRRLAEDSGCRPLAAASVGQLLADHEQMNRLRQAEIGHLQFTDQLFGPTCDVAAVTFCQLVDELAVVAGVEVSVTLHDLPSPDDEAGRYARRTSAYRRVVNATTGAVFVSSDHEASLLREFHPSARPIVIPLPIMAAQSRPARRGATNLDDASGAGNEVAILGFIHPGKGHATAVRALMALPPEFGLTALGRAADGHESLPDALTQLADGLGRTFTVSGYIPERGLMGRLRRVAIPLASHEQISASASIGTWLTAGRRPLVPDGRYTREIERRCPGSITRYEPTGDGLERALYRAFTDPGSTWLDETVRLGPSRAEVARRYHQVLTWAEGRQIAVTLDAVASP
jgi:glycosyltransferase involved in cell wall biosynthesis